MISKSVVVGEYSKFFITFALVNFKNAMKLFKLIFMARFIKILEQISPIAEGATARLVPIKADKDARKINEDCHKVNNFSNFLCYVN